MKILFLTQIVPYPPDAGPKIKTWNVLRYLANAGHEVTLASFVREEELVWVKSLSDLCADIHTVPIRRSRITDIGYMLRSYLSGRPFLIERDDLAGMRSLINRLLKSKDYDFIHADQLTMAQFALPAKSSLRQVVPQIGKQPSLVFDAHNAVWTIVERMRTQMPVLIRPIFNIEAARIKAYEGMVVCSFDHTLAVSNNDREDLLDAAEVYRSSRNGADDGQPGSDWERQKITVIPIAIDTLSLQPTERKPGSLNILTLGTLHYPPNADGIRWFVREIFPLVRQQVEQVTLTIVGKNPPADFLDFGSDFDGAVRVTGYVPDLTPYFQESALMVVPVRAGGGMRVRILEAFARAMPVVTTTVGLEGIDALNGSDVLVQDTPAGFANAVIQLLKDPVLQASLANNGRLLAEARYKWEAVLQKLDPIYAGSGVEGD